MEATETQCSYVVQKVTQQPWINIDLYKCKELVLIVGGYRDIIPKRI
jgi:hypothetical protein